MLGRGSFTLFHVRGIPIRAHWTFLIVLPYLILLFTMRIVAVARLAGVDAAQLRLPPLVWGSLTALALFASVVLHELAHSWVAIRNGGKVRDITLMMLGGISQVAKMPSRLSTQAWMAAAGPLTSVAIGLVLLLGASRTASADAHMALFYIGYLNVTIGVFNLLPAYPMDGGRIFRSLLSIWIGRTRATRWVVAVARVLAVGMGLFGIYEGSLLLVLIAFFVFTGAQAEARTEALRDQLGGLRVSELHPILLATVDAALPAEVALTRMRSLGEPRLVVVDESGQPLGLITARSLGSLSPDIRQLALGRLLGNIGVRGISVAPDENLAQALDRAGQLQAEYLFCWTVGGWNRNGERIPVIGPAEIQGALELRAARPTGPWNPQLHPPV